MKSKKTTLVSNLAVCRIQKATGWLVAVLLLVNQSLVSVAWAQSLPDSIDFDPPVIDHESVADGVAGEPQVFTALVIDDRGIEHVLFYHRRSSNVEYTSLPMSQLANTANYMVSIDTPAEQRYIEYYIEALDTGGNRVLKGFPFYPLVRELDLPLAPGLATSVAPEQQTEQSGKSNTWLYVVLGALAVGLVAGLSSGGGSSGGEPPVGEGVPLTIVASPP